MGKGRERRRRGRRGEGGGEGRRGGGEGGRRRGEEGKEREGGGEGRKGRKGREEERGGGEGDAQGGQCGVSLLQFMFKDIKFKEPQLKELVVTNMGQRPVHISFICKPNDEAYCKPWIVIKPSSAVIQPCG